MIRHKPEQAQCPPFFLNKESDTQIILGFTEFLLQLLVSESFLNGLVLKPWLFPLRRTRKMSHFVLRDPEESRLTTGTRSLFLSLLPWGVGTAKNSSSSICPGTGNTRAALKSFRLQNLPTKCSHLHTKVELAHLPALQKGRAVAVVSRVPVPPTPTLLTVSSLMALLVFPLSQCTHHRTARPLAPDPVLKGTLDEDDILL